MPNEKFWRNLTNVLWAGVTIAAVLTLMSVWTDLYHMYDITDRMETMR